METNGGYNFKRVDGDSEDLKCIYCNYLLKDAKELPCGHLICGTCLNEHTQNERFVFSTLSRISKSSSWSYSLHSNSKF